MAYVRADAQDTLEPILLGDVPLEAVSRGGRGVIYRFPFESGAGLLRPYRRGGWMRLLSRDTYFGVNRPLAELVALIKAEKRGLPVPRPLGIWYEQRGPFYRGAIATRELDGENLLVYLQSDPKESIRILYDAGKTIRKMHDAGITHADLQTENVFVTPNGIYLLDFDKARVHQHAGPIDRFRNLLRLARSMHKHKLQYSAFQFVEEGYGCSTLQDTCLEIAASLLYNFRLLDTKYPAPCVWKLDSPRWKVELRPNRDAHHMFRVLDEYGDLLKKPSTWTTRRVGDYVVKEYRVKNLLDRFRQFNDPRRFRRGWLASERLVEHNIDAPETHAYLEYRRFGFVLRSATVMEYIPDAVNVETAARDLNERGGEDAIAQFLKRIADAVNQLEMAHAYHADLSGKNILSIGPDYGRVIFIDLDSIHLDHSYGETERLKNHIQLYDSFCDFWDDAVLAPFIARMAPETIDEAAWLSSVQNGQAQRRTRQNTRWKKQGR